MANKEAYYFSHDSNARNDEKILAVRMKLGAEGYGIYFMILERLRDESDNMSIKDYNLLAFDFRVAADKVKSVIEDFELFEFTENRKHFYSKRMLNNMKLRNEKSEKARLSAEKRWEKSERNANALQSQSEGNAIKEKKVKEIKGKEIKGNVVEKKYPPTTTRDILFSKPISINQWAMITKVDETRIKECIIEFSEFKERTGENEKWQNDSDLIKNFEFWLNSNARAKIQKNQKNQSNEQREIYRNA